MRKILVPTDFSPNAEKALDYAVQLCKSFSAELYIIHVVELANTAVGAKMGTPAVNKRLMDEAELQLQLHKDSIEEEEGVKVSTGIYDEGVVDSIKLALETKGIDFVVMGTLGRSGLVEQIFGSKTAGFVPQSTVPVLVIPPEAEWNGIKNILLAVNEFDNVQQAAKPVFEIAEKNEASVHLATFSGEGFADLMVSLVQEWQLIKCSQELHISYPNVYIQTISLKGNSLRVALADYIKESEIDVLVMVTHKRNFLTSIFNPSKTRQMTYHTTIPLLAIPVNNDQ